MYKNPTIIYGFHGCDKEVALKILNQEIDFKPSSNSYDWLGHGIYFWENNYERAKQFAEVACKRSKTTIKEPFVLGTVIDLGNCLDLLDQKNLDLILVAYESLKLDMAAQNQMMPQNKPFNAVDFDFKNRELDCAVIRYTHSLAQNNEIKFDSVRAAFFEGEPLYEGAMIRKNDHIQIAILNQNCIKGVFLPMTKKNLF